jgi:hypothetical protein
MLVVEQTASSHLLTKASFICETNAINSKEAYPLDTANASPKTLRTYSILELLLASIALTIPILNLKAFLLFVSIAGLTMVLYGIALLSTGALRLATVFTYKFPKALEEINASTSIVTIGAALAVLYFQIITPANQWLQYLFGLGLLGYGVGRIVFGVLTRGCNVGLAALALLCGLIVSAISVIVLLFQSNNYLLPPFASYTSFVNLALIVIGVESLASSIVKLGYFWNGKHQLNI